MLLTDPNKVIGLVPYYITLEEFHAQIEDPCSYLREFVLRITNPLRYVRKYLEEREDASATVRLSNLQYQFAISPETGSDCSQQDLENHSVVFYTESTEENQIENKAFFRRAELFLTRHIRVSSLGSDALVSQSPSFPRILLIILSDFALVIFDSLKKSFSSVIFGRDRYHEIGSSLRVPGFSGKKARRFALDMYEEEDPRCMLLFLQVYLDAQCQLSPAIINYRYLVWDADTQRKAVEKSCGKMETIVEEMADS